MAETIKIGRATTPTITIDVEEFDVAQADKILFTISQGDKPIINVREDEMAIDGNTLGIWLSQEQTRMLNANNSARMQVRFGFGEQSVKTEILPLSIEDVLNDEVL